MSTIIIYFLILLASSECQEKNSFIPKIVDNLKVGLKMMERFLNVDPNSLLFKVFHPVGKTSGGKEKIKEEVFPFLLKFFGVDSSKMKDFALDGIIMVVHLISVIFTNKENSRKQNVEIDSSPFQYLIQQPQVLKLYDQMQDPKLTDLIIEEIKEKLKNYSPQEFDCILLLFCKTYPFVKGMQKSLKFFVRRQQNLEGSSPKNVTNDDHHREDVLWEKANWEDRMYFFLPNLSEVVNYGDECDKRFPSCQY